MFQMATKYKGRYYKTYNSSPVRDVRRQTERLGNSISQLFQQVAHSYLGILEQFIKDLDMAIPAKARKR